jgi:hypothetical protein
VSLAKLVVTEGPLTGCEFFLDGDETSIGRRTNNTIVVPDPAVSRTHGLIKPIGEGAWAYYDSGSENGTLINNNKVSYQVLATGDEIRVGNTTFRVLLSTPAPVPTSFGTTGNFGVPKDFDYEEVLRNVDSIGIPAGSFLDQTSDLAEDVSFASAFSSGNQSEPAPAESEPELVGVGVAVASPEPEVKSETRVESKGLAAELETRQLDPIRNPFSIADRSLSLTPEMALGFRELSIVAKLLLQTSDLEAAAMRVAEDLVAIGRLTRCDIGVQSTPPLEYSWRQPMALHLSSDNRHQVISKASQATGIVLASVSGTQSLQSVAVASVVGAPAVIYAERVGSEPIADNQAYLLAAVADLFGIAVFNRRR